MRVNRTLAVNPGTREIGVAVLAEADLLYYGVKTVRTRRTTQEVCKEATRIIGNLISAYRPDALALLRPLVIQPSGQRLAVVIRKVKLAAGNEGVAVYEYAPKTVRRFVCGAQGATKKDAARVIASRYPELARYGTRRSEWEEMYYAKMFDAVAAGLTCYYAGSRIV